MPGGGHCLLCPPRHPNGRRHRQRRDDPVQHCHHCGIPVCGRHVSWDDTDDCWVCARCGRR